MIRFNRKASILLLFSFSFFSLVVRYPIFGPEGSGPDSWEYKLQALQVINQGRISWIIDPILGYYGMFPPYQEVGPAITYASVSMITGIPLGCYRELGFLQIFKFDNFANSRFFTRC